MSTDTNDKAHSKFPRASLRARNRTIMMAPADLEDFKPEPRKTRSNIKLEDLLEESLSDGGQSESQQVSSAASLDSVLTDVFSDSPIPEGSEGVFEEESPVVTASEESLASLGLDDGLEELVEFESPPEQVAIAVNDVFSEHNDISAEVATPSADLMQLEQVEQVAPIARIVRTAETKIEVPIEAFDSHKSQVSEPTALASEEENIDEHVEEEQEKGSKIFDAPRGPVTQQRHVPIQSEEREHIEWQRPSKLVGFLVSFDVDRFGAYVELREGRLLVSCERGTSDNCLMISHPSVSPMHAILRVSSEGTILILDQLSEHGTRIKRCGSGKEETLLGDKSNLEHGDVVIFGECAYHVCIVKGT